MKETRDTIQTVIRQIEKAPEDTENMDLFSEEKNMDEVMNTLLGRAENLYNMFMHNPAERLEPLAELKYYMPMPDAAGLAGKIKRFVKRVLRKLVKPALGPIVEEQSRFNTAAVQAIEDLYQGIEKLSREQRSVRMIENVKKNWTEPDKAVHETE